MANANHICVFDFETGGLPVKKEKDWAEPIQLGAVMIEPKSLRMVSEFESLIQPLRPDNLHPKALEVNHLTKEQVMKGPHPQVLWADFIRWKKQFQKTDSVYNRPIAAGYNIITFDMPIVDRLCKQWGPTTKDKENDIEFQGVFNQIYSIDLMHNIWQLAEGSDFLQEFSSTGKNDIKLTTICSWMGLKFNDAHTALGDVKASAAVIIRLLKMNRSLVGDGKAGRVKFYNAFNGMTAQEYLNSL